MPSFDRAWFLSNRRRGIFDSEEGQDQMAQQMLFEYRKVFLGLMLC
jgi:hypothetical protein